jgi:integrative and conjugative element protein (TIGR02256 family)
MTPSVEFASSDGRFQVELPQDLLESMLGYCENANGVETGGLLVGFYTDRLERAVIVDISAPPRDSVASRGTFYRGTRGLARWLSELWNRRRHYYLGEWHYHPGGKAAPSDRDRSQMLEIAMSPTYRCPEAVLVVIGGGALDSWVLTAQIFLANGAIVTLAKVEADASGCMTEEV